MASKAYVASMTVAELTSELKKRGLSCRGKKKTLQNRLEEALENEELSESSSDDGREATIRAASAVISQLEGDGTNNYGSTIIEQEAQQEEEEEELVVSIEHSKRGLPLQLDNGDRDVMVEQVIQPVQPIMMHRDQTNMPVIPKNSILVEPVDQQQMNSEHQPVKDIPQSVQPEPPLVVQLESSGTPTSVLQPESTPIVQPKPTPVIQPEPTPVVQPEHIPVVQPEPSPAVQPKPTPVIQPEPTLVVQPEPTSVVQPEPTPVVQPEPTPVVQPEPTSVVLPEPTPVVQPGPTPVVQPEPTPVVQPEPIPVVQTEAIPVVHPEPTSVVQPKPTPSVQPESTPVVQPEPTPAVQPEPTPAVQPESVVQPEPTLVVQKEAIPVVQPEPAPMVHPEPTSAVQPEPTPSVQPEPTPVVQPTVQANPPTVQPKLSVVNSESFVVPEPTVEHPKLPTVQPESPTAQSRSPAVQLKAPVVQQEQSPPVLHDVQPEQPPPVEEPQSTVSSDELMSQERIHLPEVCDKKAESTSEEFMETPYQPQRTSPPRILMSDLVAEQQQPSPGFSVKFIHHESTPDKGSFLLPPITSPKDCDVESEANSIAVEPPSPNRDDVSFAVDDGSTSITGSVELTDITPSDAGTPRAIGTESGTTSLQGEKPRDAPVHTSQDDEQAEEFSKDQTSTTPSQVNDTHTDALDKDGKVVMEEDNQVGVSSQSGLVDNSGPIEVDVLVPTVEEEDMSVFSAEAAEAQNLDTTNSVTSKALQRPNVLFESASNSKRSFSASGTKPTESVGEVSVDNDGSKKRTISLSEERSERERSGTPTTKRRRISSSPKRTSERRRKWGSSVSHTPHTAISSDVLENIIPSEVKEEVSENSVNMSALEVVMNYGEDETAELKEEVQEQKENVEPSVPVEQAKYGEDEEKQEEEEDILDLGKESSMVDEYEQEWKEKEREREEQKKESLKAKQELETRRRIEARVRARQQEREEEKEKPVIRRTPSPARNPPTRILHIENLTRPFTTGQLKDLLQDGESVLVEGGYWTDRIKSHCIAVYMTMDSAIAARNRIHNLKWPRQNPRLLKADYLTPKEVQEHSNGELEIQPPSPSPMATDDTTALEVPQVEPPPKEVEQKKPKDTGRRPARDREATRKERLSSSDNKDTLVEKEAKPKSLLDDLFRKTKATPPIYWLPLSEKEANEKEEKRKAEEAEREKRREERQKERDLEVKNREKKLIEEREERARERMKRSRSRSHSPRSRRRLSSGGGRFAGKQSPPRRRSRSPRGRSSSPRRRSRSPRRRTPIRRIRRSRSPVRRKRSRSDSRSPVRRRQSHSSRSPIRRR